MKIYKIFLLFVLVSFNFIKGQDYTSQLNFADSLYKAEKYFDAVTEYKRFLFFNKDSKNEYLATYKIGLSYKAGAQLDNAIRYLTLASIKTNNSGQKYNVLVDLVRTHILRKTCKQAHKIIDNLLKSDLYKNKTNELIYWKGFAYIFEDKWEEASSQFALLEGQNELETICRDVNEQKISVTFAKVISYILPGSGQIYAGEYLSGIISLGWNILLGYHTINAAASERIFDSIVIGNLLWFRFYRGNIQNAEQFAIQKNLQITNKAMDYLQTRYMGIKP